VRAGVGDAAPRVVVRQERVRRVAVEGELQDLHARQLELVAQRLDVRRDRAEVLGDDRQVAERVARRLQERGAGSGPVAALDGGLRARGDLPVALHADEVIDAQHVDLREHHAQALDPPLVAARRHHVPAVQRVAPELPGRAEVVGRHARDDRRLALRVEEEEIGVGPHVGAVVGDEDRDVADDADAALVCVAAQSRPLAEERHLTELVFEDGARELRPRRRQRVRVAGDQLRGPGAPRRELVLLLERHEEREVLEPGPLRGAEGAEVGLERRARTRGETLGGAREQRLPVRDHRAVVDVVVGERRVVTQLVCGEEPVLDEQIEADQQRIAGERGEALVGRVAVARRPEWEHLPERLPGAHQEVDEALRLGAEIADPVPARQRGRVEKNSAAALLDVQRVRLLVRQPPRKGTDQPHPSSPAPPRGQLDRAELAALAVAVQTRGHARRRRRATAVPLTGKRTSPRAAPGCAGSASAGPCGSSRSRSRSPHRGRRSRAPRPSRSVRRCADWDRAGARAV
jgi:hypothetical protein